MVEAWNVDLGISLGTRIAVAGSSESRRSGLIAKTALDEGEGLWIDPCEAIHTWGMKFPVDALFLDRRGVIRRICQSLPPWRFAVCWRASSVLELPSGISGRLALARGHRIEFRK